MMTLLLHFVCLSILYPYHGEADKTPRPDRAKVAKKNGFHTFDSYYFHDVAALHYQGKPTYFALTPSDHDTAHERL